MSLVLKQRYRLEEKRFVPSLGEAFDAYDLTTFRPVTLWLLPKIRTQIARLFFDEHRRASDLSKDYTPSVLDEGVDQQSGAIFIVFEPIRVRTLEDILQDREQLSGDKALSIFVRLLKALRLFHEGDVIHGRLNPMNIVIAQGSERIIGFGLTYLQKVNALEQKQIAYLSPEQVTGEMNTTASDLYAAGAILYRCLIGESLFVPDILKEARSPSNTSFDKVLESTVLIPPALKPIVSKLLERDPSKRYLVSEHVLRDLANIQLLHR